MKLSHSIRRISWVATWSCVCALSISGCLPKNDTQALTISTSSLPAETVGQPCSASVSATGGTPPYSWSVSPALPAGLSLDTTTGAITGTPTAEGTSSLTFSVIDSSTPKQAAHKALTLTVKPVPPPLSITTTSLADGFVGQTYNKPVAATGGTPPLSWSIVAPGTLPPVLSLDPGTGVISGTATTAGTFSFNVRVADSGGQADTQALSIIIRPPTPPTITTISLPGGTVGLPYDETLSGNGGTGTLVWSISAGSLPTNLSIGPTGTISGTPTIAGTSNFTVKVTDSLSQFDTQALSITISSALTITTTSPLPNARVDRSYSRTLQRSGGVSPFTWSVTPPLPAGLNLNPSTGQISGTPDDGTEGTYSLTFTVKDSSTPIQQTASKPLSLTVTPP
jgi:Putative Ig domain